MIKKLIQKFTLPIISERDGHKGLTELYAAALDSQYLPPSQIKSLQLKKIKKLLVHAYQNTKFYRERFDKCGFSPKDFNNINDIYKIPVLHKKDIIENLSDMIAANYCSAEQYAEDRCRYELHYSLSGGTTGASIGLYNSRESLTQKLAFQLRFDQWSGWEIGEWIAILWPAVVDMKQKPTPYRSKIKNSLSFRNIMLQQAVVDDRSFRKFCNQLKKMKATALRGFPFQMNEMARYCQTHNISFTDIKGAIATGEPLYLEQRERIENAFHCRVFDSYRTREVGCVAQECEKHQGYHISAESVFVDIVHHDDKKGVRKVPNGQEGKIIITDLINYAMPFIRYEIGDVGLISDRVCNCGRGLPMLERIGGRISDQLYSPNRQKVSPVSVIPNLFHLIGIMNQFRIVQDQYDHLIIQMVAPPPPEHLLNQQHDAIRKLFGPDMKVSYSFVEEITPVRSGKYPFIISRIVKDN